MKRTKQIILKGLLLYNTCIYTLLFFMCVIPMLERGLYVYSILGALLQIILIFLCKEYVEEDDFDLLTFGKFVDEYELAKRREKQEEYINNAKNNKKYEY